MNEMLAPREAPTTIQVDKRDRKYLAALAHATGLPRRLIVTAALQEWRRRHCPDNSISGKTLIDGGYPNE